jgi:hypothetical protein
MATPIEPTEVQGEPSAEGNAPGPNPAWESVLGVLPEEFHPLVTPEFQKWDQAAQQRIEQANQQVAQFEGFKPFVENNIPIADLEQGLRLMYEINQNPQAVYSALGEAYGLTAAQVESVVESTEGEEEEEPQSFQDPRVDQLQQGVELIAQNLLEQHQSKLNAEVEAEIDSDLQALREKHGTFDERYVLSLMAANEEISMDQAFEAYQQLTQQILQQNPRPFAPSVMGNSGGGTGLPSQAIDPTKLDGKATRNLVAEMLKAANDGT